MEYISSTYNVPAKLGGRVKYTGGATPQTGTITGARGPHIKVRMDGEKRDGYYHPTWEVQYLDDNGDMGCLVEADLIGGES